MTVTEKVAYLRGLCEGMAIDDTTNEGKLLKEIINVLEDMAYSIADVEDGLDELSEEVEALDDGMASIENDLYEDDEDEDEEDDDEEIYEASCPKCGEKICFDYDMLCNGSIECPNCGEELEFELDGCDCGCCDECDGEEADEVEDEKDE